MSQVIQIVPVYPKHSQELAAFLAQAGYTEVQVSRAHYRRRPGVVIIPQCDTCPLCHQQAFRRHITRPVAVVVFVHFKHTSDHVSAVQPRGAIYLEDHSDQLARQVIISLGRPPESTHRSVV